MENIIVGEFTKEKELKRQIKVFLVIVIVFLIPFIYFNNDANENEYWYNVHERNYNGDYKRMTDRQFFNLKRPSFESKKLQSLYDEIYKIEGSTDKEIQDSYKERYEHYLKEQYNEMFNKFWSERDEYDNTYKWLNEGIEYYKYKIELEYDEESRQECYQKMTSSRNIANLLLPVVSISIIIFGVSLFIYYYVRKMRIEVSEKAINGFVGFGKEVSLPIDSITSISKGSFNSLSLNTSSNSINFRMISNCDEIYKRINELLVNRQS